MERPTYAKRAIEKPGRVDLKLGEFQALIEDQGCRVRITPAMVCPRRTSRAVEETDHDLNCPLCHGSLVVDVPNNTVESWAFVQGIQFDKTFSPQGMYDAKDAQISFMAEIRVWYWFKVEIVDFGSLFNQLLMRSVSGNVDTLRYPAIEAWDGNFYHAMDGNGQVYTRQTDTNPGGDYTVAGDKLTWVGSRKPEAGKLYSIIYPMLPTFRVLELIHANRYYYDGFKKPRKTPVQYPQQAQIRWDYLAKGGFDVLRQK